MTNQTLRRGMAVATGVVAVAALTIVPSAATFPTVAGDRLYLNANPCDDGATSVRVYAAAAYTAPTAGYYQIRLGTYTQPDNGRLGLGPLPPWRYLAAGGRLQTTHNDTFFTVAQAHETAFVWRWNSSLGAWQQVARKSVVC